MEKQPGPWRLTSYALAQVLLFAPTIVAVVLVVLGAGLAVITVGIPILLVSVPALRWITGVHRSMAARTLGYDVPAGYLPTEGLRPDAAGADLGTGPDDLAGHRLDRCLGDRRASRCRCSRCCCWSWW